MCFLMLRHLDTICLFKLPKGNSSSFPIYPATCYRCKSGLLKFSVILGLLSSLAETPESVGMLKYFAQIWLQMFTSFLQIYDVPRTYEQSDGRRKEEKASFIDFWPFVKQNLVIFHINPAVFICFSTFIINFAANL